jgi:hypothetical protein
MERGKARYSHISSGSNSRVKSGAGTLYRIISSNPSGGTIRVDDSLDLGQSPNLNASGSDTIVNASASVLDFGPGLGINAGIVVAASSNAKVTVVYE